MFFIFQGPPGLDGTPGMDGTKGLKGEKGYAGPRGRPGDSLEGNNVLFIFYRVYKLNDL